DRRRRARGARADARSETAARSTESSSRRPNRGAVERRASCTRLQRPTARRTDPTSASGRQSSMPPGGSSRARAWEVETRARACDANRASPREGSRYGPRVIEPELRRLHVRGDLSALATRTLAAYGPEILGFLLATLESETAAADVYSQFCCDLW